MAQGPPSNALDGAVPTGVADLESCIALSALFRSPLVRVTRWRCVREGRPLAAERSHPWPVLTLCESGASVVHHPGGRSLVEPASVVLHPPHLPYRTTHPFGCGDEGVNVSISPDLAAEVGALRFAGATGDEPWPFAVVAAPLPSRLTFFLLLRDLRAGRVVDPLAVEEALIGLLAAALAAAPASARPGGTARRGTGDVHRDLAFRARSALFTRLHEPLRLSDVATAVGASAFHLARVFRRETGLSLHEYLTRLRLLATLPHAADAGTSLAELALAHGFSSHSHLTSTFRQRFGVAPAAVRRRATAGGS